MNSPEVIGWWTGIGMFCAFMLIKWIIERTKKGTK
jgi:hypothetical protein